MVSSNAARSYSGNESPAEIEAPAEREASPIAEGEESPLLGRTQSSEWIAPRGFLWIELGSTLSSLPLDDNGLIVFSNFCKCLSRRL